MSSYIGSIFVNILTSLIIVQSLITRDRINTRTLSSTWQILCKDNTTMKINAFVVFSYKYRILLRFVRANKNKIWIPRMPTFEITYLMAVRETRSISWAVFIAILNYQNYVCNILLWSTKRTHDWLDSKTISMLSVRYNV